MPSSRGAVRGGNAWRSTPPVDPRERRGTRASQRFAAKTASASGPGGGVLAAAAPPPDRAPTAAAAAASDQGNDGGQSVVRIKPMGAGGGGGEASAAPDAAPMQFSSEPPAVLVGSKEFRYPRHVIGPDRDQQSLFDEFMPARIQAFLDGHNVNVMAYGQTGSGKTHTVFGPPGIMAKAGCGQLGLGTVDDYGIFPRGLRAIYERVKALNAATTGTTYFLTASCVELSMMGNLDMLVKSHDARNAERDKSWSSRQGSGPQLDKFSKPPRLYGMVELPMETPDDVLRIFAAIASRNTSGTLMNDSSSRSHCVCWLTLFARDHAADAVRRSRFQFVDLAGSERVKEASGSAEGLWSGGTATEGLCTNWSLMMLSRAARDIVASGKRGPGKKRGQQKLAHTAGYLGDLVPLLADSLTGDALTAVFVCVSQAPDNVAQSKIALDFGQVFSKLTVGTRQQPLQARAKLIKELLAKQQENDATLARGVAGKFQAVRMGKQLDYNQVLAAMAKLGPVDTS